jgi:hypothetical protein
MSKNFKSFDMYYSCWCGGAVKSFFAHVAARDNTVPRQVLEILRAEMPWVLSRARHDSLHQASACLLLYLGFLLRRIL